MLVRENKTFDHLGLSGNCDGQFVVFFFLHFIDQTIDDESNQ